MTSGSMYGFLQFNVIGMKLMLSSTYKKITDSGRLADICSNVLCWSILISVSVCLSACHFNH